MDGQIFSLEADGIAVALDLGNGHIAAFEISSDGRRLEPLHRAPWIGDALPADLPSGLTRLSGDFFCAPFSRSDVEPAPTHGWPANAPWAPVSQTRHGDAVEATFRLTRPVMGATIEKRWTLRAGHPFLYQEHRILGGEGRLPVAHHVMTRMAAGGRLDVSPKRLAFTPAEAMELDPAQGRYALAYPGETTDLGAFPMRDGSTADLHRFSPAESHEDFLTLVEAFPTGLGWSAVSRETERDLVLVLKNNATLPVTMLWMSNGGRDYAPWNGRHTGVLGIEDGRTAIGHAESIGDNRLTRMGVPTSFDLGEAVVVRQVLGATAIDRTSPVTVVKAQAGHLLVERRDQNPLALPFDDGFLV